MDLQECNAVDFAKKLDFITPIVESRTTFLIPK
jgi:hypothetical protein